MLSWLDSWGHIRYVECENKGVFTLLSGLETQDDNNTVEEGTIEWKLGSALWGH